MVDTEYFIVDPDLFILDNEKAILDTGVDVTRLILTRLTG